MHSHHARLVAMDLILREHKNETEVFEYAFCPWLEGAQKPRCQSLTLQGIRSLDVSWSCELVLLIFQPL